MEANPPLRSINYTLDNVVPQRFHQGRAEAQREVGVGRRSNYKEQPAVAAAHQLEVGSTAPMSTLAFVPPTVKPFKANTGPLSGYSATLPQEWGTTAPKHALGKAAGAGNFRRVISQLKGRRTVVLGFFSLFLLLAVLTVPDEARDAVRSQLSLSASSAPWSECPSFALPFQRVPAAKAASAPAATLLEPQHWICEKLEAFGNSAAAAQARSGSSKLQAISRRSMEVVSLQWQIPMDPQEVLVNVGDTVTLSWSGTHSVSSILNEADYADCVFSSEGSVLVADTSVNEYSQTFSAAGSFYFACDVSSHCSAGQKLTVTVLELVSTPAPTNAPTKAPSEAVADGPAEAPSEADADGPAEAPSEADADGPAEAPSEEPAPAPSEADADGPAEAPSEEPAPVDSVSDSDSTDASSTSSPTPSPPISPPPPVSEGTVNWATTCEPSTQGKCETLGVATYSTQGAAMYYSMGLFDGPTTFGSTVLAPTGNNGTGDVFIAKARASSWHGADPIISVSAAWH
ncbi:hypothetical protein CYMTET_5884 [Cymbomonas tetramitiformis]|uniref:Phytocyanin domain-containing protein n=1 Tax=Cymbomonas tetramitiformis TaxID=36881 RepID=A0AAE0LIZ3_9CHLO|nr:hypothetical protein CYMTET_5884 [Cymbomonas tetramitiformis]